VKNDTVKKATLGVMGQYAVREDIYLRVCYFVVGFVYPGCARASKGGGVHSLKHIMSWV